MGWMKNDSTSPGTHRHGEVDRELGEEEAEA